MVDQVTGQPGVCADRSVSGSGCDGSHTHSSELSAIYAGERGSASEVRSFEADLLPTPGKQFAALVNGDDGSIRTDVDYFTLSPKEPEEFFLSLNYVPGYIYKYRVGVHYRFKGRDDIHWLTGPIRAGIPNYPLPVAEFETGEFTVRDHPDYRAEMTDEVPSRSTALLHAVEAGKVFKPEQLPK